MLSSRAWAFQMEKPIPARLQQVEQRNGSREGMYDQESTLSPTLCGEACKRAGGAWLHLSYCLDQPRYDSGVSTAHAHHEDTGFAWPAVSRCHFFQPPGSYLVAWLVYSWNTSRRAADG